MKINNLILLVFSLALLSACGGNKSNSGNTEKSVITQPDNPQKSAAELPGKKVYDSVCLACHMADGTGVPGMHPPIVESDFGDDVMKKMDFALEKLGQATENFRQRDGFFLCT